MNKNNSWVNQLIFPAPRPTYTHQTFSSRARRPREDVIIWIPRNNPGERREADAAHDPDSVPCLWCPVRKRSGSKYLMLFCHGNGEDLGSASRLLFSLRSSLNVNVLGIEFPGYGINQHRGNASESKLNSDIQTVYSFVRQVLEWPEEHIILFGFSIGTGPLTQLASTVAKQVGGLVLLAPYTSIRDMVTELARMKGMSAAGRFAGYLIANRFVNKEAIKDVEAPTLIIHGEQDSLVPCDHGRLVYKNCGAKRKQLYVSESMDHCFQPDDVESFILFPIMEFFATHEQGGFERQANWPDYVFAQPGPPVATPVDAVDMLGDFSEIGDALDFAAAAQEPAREWDCPRCTFHNGKQSAVCEMCEGARPESIACRAQVQLEGMDASVSLREMLTNRRGTGGAAAMGVAQAWVCAVCTYENEPSDLRIALVCGVCASIHPSSQQPGQIPYPVKDDQQDRLASEEEEDQASELPAKDEQAEAEGRCGVRLSRNSQQG